MALRDKIACVAILALASCEDPPVKEAIPVKVEQKALGGEPLMTGPMSREEIQEVILANLDQIKQCHQQELRPCPPLASKVVVRFVIGPDGKVTQAEIKMTTLADPKVENCMLERIRAWKFPRPRGGGIVDVTYPFVFTVP